MHPLLCSLCILLASAPALWAADKQIPNPKTRILIYCNNNFENAPKAFPSKGVTASLNIYTFNSLHAYGYTNVYEPGPLVDIQTTRLPLEGTARKNP